MSPSKRIDMFTVVYKDGSDQTMMSACDAGLAHDGLGFLEALGKKNGCEVAYIVRLGPAELEQ